MNSRPENLTLDLPQVDSPHASNYSSPPAVIKGDLTTVLRTLFLQGLARAGGNGGPSQQWRAEASSSIPGILIVTSSFTGLPLQPESIPDRNSYDRSLRRTPVDLSRFLKIQGTLASGADYSSATINAALIHPASFMQMGLILNQALSKNPGSARWMDLCEHYESQLENGERRHIWHFPSGRFHIGHYETHLNCVAFNAAVEQIPQVICPSRSAAINQNGDMVYSGPDGKSYHCPSEYGFGTAQSPIEAILAYNEGIYWTPGMPPNWLPI